jgi:hypothetical protein
LNKKNTVKLANNSFGLLDENITVVLNSLEDKMKQKLQISGRLLFIGFILEVVGIVLLSMTAYNNNVIIELWLLSWTTKGGATWFL